MAQNIIKHAQGDQTCIYVHHVWLGINDKEDCVDSKLCRGDGSAMLGFDTLCFREARPEHIQKVLRQATEDVEAVVFEQDWVPLDCHRARHRHGLG